MKHTAEFIGTIVDDGDRYDVWEDDEGVLYASEFCQDNLEPLPPEKAPAVETELLGDSE